MLCRAGRPLAAGEPKVVCEQFVPSVSRAARPSAVSALVVAVERRYALAFARCEAKSQHQFGNGTVLNTKVRSRRVQQAPNPSFERTANGVRRSGASSDAVPPLSAAQVKR